MDRYIENFKKLELHCGLSRERIPQLKDLDEYLKSTTGFRLKPVHGILSQREFLDALAHKVKIKKKNSLPKNGRKLSKLNIYTILYLYFFNLI